MADYLIEFIEGQTIKASEHNSNNQYLLDQINDSIKTLNAKVSSIQSNLQTQLQNLYPVGAIYLGVTAECPLASLFGTWEKVASDRVIQGSGSLWKAGDNPTQGLPEILGSFYDATAMSGDTSGAFYGTGSGVSSQPLYASGVSTMNFQASRSNSTYSEPHGRVQPYAYVVNVWQRVA